MKAASNIKEDTKSVFRYIKREARVDIEPLQNDAGVAVGNKQMVDEMNTFIHSRIHSNVPQIHQGADVS